MATSARARLPDAGAASQTTANTLTNATTSARLTRAHTYSLTSRPSPRSPASPRRRPRPTLRRPPLRHDAPRSGTAPPPRPAVPVPASRAAPPRPLGWLLARRPRLPAPQRDRDPVRPAPLTLPHPRHRHERLAHDLAAAQLAQLHRATQVPDDVHRVHVCTSCVLVRSDRGSSSRLPRRTYDSVCVVRAMCAHTRACCRPMTALRRRSH